MFDMNNPASGGPLDGVYQARITLGSNANWACRAHSILINYEAGIRSRR